MRKFQAIESARGYMAWWVVLAHAQYVSGMHQFLPASLASWVGRGNLAVQVFMIVSGFVIAHLLVSRDETYKAFIIRRWFRLAPLFLVVLLISIATRDLYAITYLENPFPNEADMRSARLIHENRYWFSHLALHLALLHGMLPDTVFSYSSSSFLAPAWSLSLEWQFYLLAPLILAGLVHWRKSAPVVILLLVSVPALSGMMGEWRFPSFLPLALPFFFGGIASRLLLEGKIPWLAGGITIIATAIYVGFQGMSSMAYLLLVAAIWAFFLFVTARESGIISVRSKWLDRLSWIFALNPVITAIGKVSYSTYLCHISIFGIVIGSGIFLTGRTDHMTIVALTVIAMILVIPMSFLLYYYVEKPGIAFGSRLSRGKNIPQLAPT